MAPAGREIVHAGAFLFMAGLSFLVSPETIEQQKLVAGQVQNAYDRQVSEQMATQRTQMTEDIWDKRTQEMEQRAQLRAQTQIGISNDRIAAGNKKLETQDNFKAAQDAVSKNQGLFDMQIKPLQAQAGELATKNPTPENLLFAQQVTSLSADAATKLSAWSQKRMNSVNDTTQNAGDFNFSDLPIFNLVYSDITNPLIKSQIEQHQAQTAKDIASISQGNTRLGLEQQKVAIELMGQRSKLEENRILAHYGKTDEQYYADPANVDIDKRIAIADARVQQIGGKAFGVLPNGAPSSTLPVKPPASQAFLTPPDAQTNPAQ